jgi:hypothetical protein
MQFLRVFKASFTPVKIMAGGKVAGVTIRATPVMEEKTPLTLLLVLLLFLCLYCNYNRNTIKEN